MDTFEKIDFLDDHSEIIIKKKNRLYNGANRTNRIIAFIMLLIVAIKFDSPRPVLFKQKRVGIHKSHFKYLKFRTMHIDTPKDTPTHYLENPEQWITKVVKILRKTSLDELPQIIIILRGDMAIVRPRPALWNQYDLIEERDSMVQIMCLLASLAGRRLMVGMNLRSMTRRD